VRKQVVEIWMPWKRPCGKKIATSLLKLYATRRKRGGERVNPCMSPLSALKNGDIEAFMRMTKYVVEIQLIIHMRKE
jgi:hypothetical protein